MDPVPTTAPVAHFLAKKNKFSFFGLTLDDCIKTFFGGNAVVSIIVLALITIFLFREGAGFFGQNRDSLIVYRQAGLEYVDFMRVQSEEHTALTRYLSDIRLRALRYATEEQKLTLEAANAALVPFDEFAGEF